jgi:hypothetical protein
MKLAEVPGKGETGGEMIRSGCQRFVSPTGESVMNEWHPAQICTTLRIHPSAMGFSTAQSATGDDASRINGAIRQPTRQNKKKRVKVSEQASLAIP